VSANELAVVYQKYPQITASMLESRTIHLLGIIQHVEIDGLDRETAEIKLDTDRHPNIYVDDNLKLFLGSNRAQWEKNGQSIASVTEFTKNNVNTKHLFTVGEKFASTLAVRMHRCTPSSIYFDVHQ
jgi:hypothetical protein